MVCVSKEDYDFDNRGILSDRYIVFSSNEDLKNLNEILRNIKFNLSNDDSNLSYNIEKIESTNYIRESKNIVEFISKIKNGLLETYEYDGFPLLSSNIGKISVENDFIDIKYSIRSSNLLKENKLLKEIELLSNQCGFKLTIDAKKPFFPFRENSIIRKLLSETYKELYNKETTVKKVRACMEGGILSSNIDDLDICTIAPTINNCHSIDECVSISSIKRVYNWLKETLVKFNSFER